MFFPSDSVTTWLCRGIVWTLSSELLIVALSPFELALWSTHRGERISQRVEAKKSLLDHESARRRIGRRAALAIVTLMVPLALIAVGVGQHIPTSHAATPPKVTQVTRVVRVVKPVRVQRVVKIRTVSEQVPVAVATPPTYRAPSPTSKSKRTTQKHSSPVMQAPKAHTHVTEPQTQSTPTAPTSTPAPAGTQTQSSLPTPDQSGATASPTS